SPAIQGVLEGRITSVSGLWGSSKALFSARLQAETGRPLLVILPTEEAAEERFHDLEFYARWQGKQLKVSFFPSWEVLPYDSFSPHAGLIHRRMTTLHALLTEPSAIVVASVPAAIQRLIPRKRLQEAVRSVRIGLEISPDKLCTHLVDVGYEPVSTVTQRGEFSPRGGILDLYSPVEPFPLRIEFFGDRVESLRWFDPETQRSLPPNEAPAREEALLFPAREIFGPDLPASGGESLAPQVYGTLDTLFDYAAGGGRLEDLIVIHEEPAEIRRKTREFLDKAAESYAIHQDRGDDVPPPETLYLPEEPFLAPKTLELTSLAVTGEGAELPIRSVESLVTLKRPSKELPSGDKGLPLETAAREIERTRQDHLVVLVCATEGQRERIRELLEEYDTPAAPVSPEEIGPLSQTPGIKPVLLVAGKVSTGFADSEDRLLLITDEEIFGKKFRGRGPDRGESRTGGQKGKGARISFEELRPGDFIVHQQHGIGRYEGLRHLTLNHAEGDYLIIRYAGEGSVYLPVDKLQMVQKYVGTEGHAPVMDRLGGARWERTKKKVQKAVEEIARDLVELYASREMAPGYAFSGDSAMMRELEATFEYDETPDQSAAIEAVKRSMEAHRPMDHLVCGDVGFGKTEVAIRAAGKAVMDGKQVAVLVPTTLLAQQHWQNFSSRFAPFPVRVEMLSRFRTRREQLEILKDVTAGKVDILIGTHRLLSKDLQFRDLGLVVLDEEQRFGVAQKERLKQMKKTVDVLTLTATPIPRTLQMGLTSLREMSVIETAPVDRLSIRTL
ncbi:MAG: DEAD/DEAH box helicase, partial [Nitrospirae bacterium]|nr:DEAD/DEAH box helicase [Nitrospirota bacterium]